MKAVPVIETPRLRLRAHRAADLDACAEMWSDPDVVRHIGGEPSSRGRTWQRLLAYAGHWSLLGFGYWAVEERKTGSFVGELGFAHFERDLVPDISAHPEFGWAFATRVRGRGYATEAALAALAWRDRGIDGDETVALIDPQNHASLRVAQKCGFAETARTVLGGRPIVLLAR